MGRSFVFPPPPLLRRFRVFSISALGDVGQWPPRGTSPGTQRIATERENGGITTRIRIFRYSWGGLLFFLASPPLLRRFRVFCISALGVGRQWPPLGKPPGTPAESRGALRIGKRAELRAGSGILGAHGSAFCFLSSPHIYGGFVYLSFPRWVLGVNGHPRGTSPGAPRSVRGGKISELRIESGILGIHGSAFRFSVSAAPSTAVSCI